MGGGGGGGGGARGAARREGRDGAGAEPRVAGLGGRVGPLVAQALAPEAPASAIVLVDARVLELDQICIHVPRGFLAVVEPGALVRHARAIVVRT